MNTIDYTAELGKRFVTLLEESVTPEQFEEIRTRNDARRPGTCASHDFIDANEVMEDAFTEVLGRSPAGTGVSPEVYADPDLSDADIAAIEAQADAQHNADNVLWGRAWDWAIEHYLSHSDTAMALENAGYPEARS